MGAIFPRTDPRGIEVYARSLRNCVDQSEETQSAVHQTKRTTISIEHQSLPARINPPTETNRDWKMGVLVKKAPLYECVHDGAMARVATKTLALFESRESCEARPAEVATALGESLVSMRPTALPRRTPLASRKRRLPQDARPTKYRKLAMRQLVPMAIEDKDSETASPAAAALGSPTSLQVQFALPDLSSGETQLLFQELVSARSEISWLNGTMPQDISVHPVFGWRSALWRISTPMGDDAVIMKSAKAFESVDMAAVAQRMWSCTPSHHYPDVEAREQVYAITKHLRVVRQRDRLHGRASRTALWLESVRRQGESVMIMRKELHHFQGSTTSHRSPRERECHGYILHPLLIPMGSQVVTGTAVHALSSLRSRGQAPGKLIHGMLREMPRHVLQWEDCFVHDTSC